MTLWPHRDMVKNYIVDQSVYYINELYCPAVTRLTSAVSKRSAMRIMAKIQLNKAKEGETDA